MEPLAKPANARTFPVQATITFLWIFSVIVFVGVLLYLSIVHIEILLQIPEWVENLIVFIAGFIVSKAGGSSDIWLDRISQFPVPGAIPPQSDPEDRPQGQP